MLVFVIYSLKAAISQQITEENTKVIGDVVEISKQVGKLVFLSKTRKQAAMLRQMP